MFVSFLSLCGRFLFFIFFNFLTIGFTLDSSMIEVVFIHPFEFCELFYKYSSSLGMVTLFYSALFILRLGSWFYIPSISLTFFSSK